MDSFNIVNKYIFDLYSKREAMGWTWLDIRNLVNEKYDIDLSEEACRKRAKRFYNSSVRLGLNYIPDNDENSEDTFLKLKEERYKISDERVQVSALIRRVSREETIKEIAREYANSLDNIYKLPTFNDLKLKDNQTKEAILLISDWHYGLDINNVFNIYNTDICKNRVALLKDKVLHLLEDEDISVINIVNLGDMIAGRIHLPIRLNSRIDVITQTMDIAEILAQFISCISSKGYTINYYSTTDNHSRIEPVIKDSLELESLVRIIDWFLKERLRNNNHVKFHDNSFGDDIVIFNVLSHKIAGVHGNKDKLDKVIDRVSTFTQQHYDLICSAHYHHFSCEEKNETVLVSNSSLMGTDDFAYNLRLNSKPSQVLIISTINNVCDHLYKINLDEVIEKDENSIL